MNTLKKKMLRRAKACALSLMLLATMTGCAVSAATESAVPAESQTTAENTENTENADEKKEPEKTTVYYVTDEVQQSQFLKKTM